MNISSIAYAPYNLHAKQSLNSQSSAKLRPGMLLRITWSDGLAGYADCHPWPELGDPSLQELLSELQARSIHTPLLECSLALARLAAQEKQANRSVFHGLTPPPCHWLINDISLLSSSMLTEISNQGFTHVKVKIGRDALLEACALKQLLKDVPGKSLCWRLDVNSSWTPAQFESFMAYIADEAAHIDFIEDPTPFCLRQWQQWQSTYGITLAADRWLQQAWGDRAAAAVLVLKPAMMPLVQQLNALTTGQRCVVTSYLDHPLGQLGAAFSAALLYQFQPAAKEVCGFLSHHCYAPHAFSETLKVEKACFVPSALPGWGIEPLLEQEKWLPLSLCN